MKLQLPPPSWLNKGVKYLASTPLGTWLLSHSLNRLDRLVARMAHTSLATLLAGLPVLIVTTRDAETGGPHVVPLVGIPQEDDIVLIASNWGGRSHPKWYRNLLAFPRATLSYRGESAEFAAREVEGKLREDYWRRAVEIYPGFKTYEQRAGERRIPIMLLTPIAP